MRDQWDGPAARRRNGEVTDMRKSIREGLAVATLGLGLFLGHAAAADKIIISNWDGYMPKDLLENFTKETGIEAEMAVHATNEEIMGKIMAGQGKGFDVLFVSSPYVEALRSWA
jgi:spermidine/putrescine transport system substrate-binding protein